MTEQQQAAMRQALEQAYLAGFMASGEGYNGEYPFQDHNQKPEDDKTWCTDRDNAITALRQALEQADHFRDAAKMMATTEESSDVEQQPAAEPSPGGVLFAVEEAIRNGDCPFAIEIAFDAYEAERKAMLAAAPKKGN